MWLACLVVIFITSVEAISQPLYKIALTQKGFPQYLQYDVDSPPIREFTLCVWIRIFEFSDKQTIFTYTIHDKKQVIKLWIEDEGKLIKVSIKNEASSSTTVDLIRDVWHHICLSYQSDFGAWALYLNGRLASCEAAQSIYGYKLPTGGHFIFGSGSSQNGSASVIEGEIYDVNVILVSAIEKNNKSNQHHNIDKQKNYKTKINTNDIISHKQTLGQQVASQTLESVNSSNQKFTRPRSFIKISTPHSQFEYDIGVDLNSNINLKNKTELMNLPNNKKHRNNNIIHIWELLNKNKLYEPFGSNTKELPTISEIETPPPAPIKTTSDTYKTLHTLQQNSFPVYKLQTEPLKFSFGSGENKITDFNPNLATDYYNLQQSIPDIEVPPPVEKKMEVHGQWTTSSFAKDVLNYLKSINSFSTPQMRVPETIPLLKNSDFYPYSSELVPLKIFAPPHIRESYFLHKIKKRESKQPEINVEILENDIRTLILEEHANTHPQNVEITNRGKNKMNEDNRIYRNDNIGNSGPVHSASNIDNHKLHANNDNMNLGRNFHNSFINTLPNIFHLNKKNIVEYDNVYKSEMIHRNEMYMNSLSNESKWHNIKFHGGVFYPRDIKHYSNIRNQPKDNKIYNPQLNNIKNYKDYPYYKDETRTEIISSLSSTFDKSSLPNNEHGLFTDQTPKAINDLNFVHKIDYYKDKFNQRVKIGNALNERDIIGKGSEWNKNSFVGGNENIPDIQRYRSDIDDGKEYVPPSLVPKICKNIVNLDRLLSLDPDVFSDIMSMKKIKNYGLHFIMASYKCLEYNVMVENRYSQLIVWSETPVRLFGGAYPKKIVKQCGFF